ncbi:MAG: hypothetical protein JOZ96_02785 [Acidobacteria bacterium]|nr:hypothetical protein [Acidobacteriota bacterium]
MNNPVCAVCGHVNRAGAAACEACDARLYESEGATDFGDASEPFDPPGESSWAASDAAGPGRAWSPDDDGPTSPADDIPAPPFKGAGDVISPMLAVYRKHFTLVGILVLVATLPQALLQYGIMDVTGLRRPVAEAVARSAGAALAFTVLSSLLFWLLAVAASALLSGALVYAVVDLQRAGHSSAGECLSRGLKALPNVFLVSLLYGVVTTAGYVALIVPGVILSLMFAVCVPAAVVEGLGPIASLQRSHELTKGYKGLIFITFFLWGLLVLALGGVVTWSFASAGKLDLLPTLLLQTAVLGMLNSTLHVLTVYIYLGLLRERRSGFQK